MTWWIVALSGLGISLILLILIAVLATWQRRAAREAREWGRQVLQAQEDERRRIARELHDGVVSELVRTRSTVIAAGVDEVVPARLQQMAMDLRAISHGLHPPSLGTATIAQMLGDLMDDEAEHSGPAITLEGRTERELNETTRLALYRVAQEAIANVRKHARATQVTLTLREDAHGLQLTVDDDGAGIAERDAHGHSFGLRSMRERMAMIGGTLTVAPRPGGGTRVVARLPHQ